MHGDASVTLRCVQAITWMLVYDVQLVFKKVLFSAGFLAALVFAGGNETHYDIWIAGLVGLVSARVASVADGDGDDDDDDDRNETYGYRGALHLLFVPLLCVFLAPLSVPQTDFPAGAVLAGLVWLFAWTLMSLLDGRWRFSIAAQLAALCVGTVFWRTPWVGVAAGASAVLLVRFKASSVVSLD